MKPLPPKNHRCFEAAAADILARCYEAFPGTISVDAREDYCRLREEEKIMPHHCDEINEDHDPVMLTTAAFLKREGLITFDECDNWSADKVTLTSRGFVLLREPEKLLKTGDGTPLGEQIRKVATKAGSSALTATINSVIKVLAS